MDESEREWLSLGAASRLLGVNADSLRRWANTGRVACITTPGGHRRFARSSLEAILEPRNVVAASVVGSNGNGHANDRTVADAKTRAVLLAGSAPLVAAAYRRSYVRTVESTDAPEAATGGPARTLPTVDLDRRAFRVDGRRLVGALLRALDATEDGVRADAEAEAMGIAGTHARRLAEARVPLADAVRMFIRARRPFLAELRAIAHRQRLDPAAVLALYDDASGLLDRLLIAFVAAHAAPSGKPAHTKQRRSIS